MRDENRNKKFSFKIFWQDFTDRVWNFYFYLFSFYIVSRILAFFFKSWQNYFDWASFDFFIIFFTILIFLHPKLVKFTKTFFNKLFNFKIKPINLRFNKIKFPDLTSVKTYLSKLYLLLKWLLSVIKFILAQSFLVIKLVLKEFYFLIKKNIYNLWQFVLKQLKKINWGKSLILKLIFIAGVAIYILFFKEIDIIDFWVLFYALVSVLFVLDNRFAAGIALFLLVICPFLLILKQEYLAEIIAGYAYYFLTIAVITAIREFLQEKQP